MKLKLFSFTLNFNFEIFEAVVNFFVDISDKSPCVKNFVLNSKIFKLLLKEKSVLK
jgi:hypothetical protein